MFKKDKVHDYGNHRSIYMKLPSFHGRSGFREYIKWEDKMEFLFEGQFYSEQEKVKLAVTTFIEDAAKWWQELKIRRRIYGKRPIEKWDEMKALMRKRHTFSHCFRDLDKRFQFQNNECIDGYYQEEKPIDVQKREIDRESREKLLHAELKECLKNFFSSSQNQELPQPTEEASNMNNVDEEETIEMKNNLSPLIKVEDDLQQRKEANSSPVELSFPLPRDSIFRLQVLEDPSSNLLLMIGFKNKQDLRTNLLQAGENDENQGAKLRCPIQHSINIFQRLRVKIFMKNFHGLIQEVWAKYKDEKLKISPITSPTIQPSSSHKFPPFFCQHTFWRIFQ